MIERIPVNARTRAPTGKTNACLIGTDEALLVDPAGEDSDLSEQIETRNVEHVAVTHHHPDHVGAVATYAREYDLRVWARYGREAEFERTTGIAPDEIFREGTTVPAGNGVDVVETPGHAPEHVAFCHDGAWVSGDLAVAEGSVVVGAPDGDMRAYLTSLRRVHARNPDTLFPAHGPVIQDSRAVCRRLLSHRLDRESRLREAVAAGYETPEALVETVYEKDVSAVFELARATVVAHLEKLAVEGAIDWDGNRAHPA